MKVTRVRYGHPRRGIEYTEQAIVDYRVMFKTVKRLAVHRWGQGWHWDDTNRPCPAVVEQALNRGRRHVD